MASQDHSSKGKVPSTTCGIPLEPQDNFWAQYERLTDQYDRDMMVRLNSNLDNLLIFGGLFASIISGFIISTLGNLSDNPLSQTNALLQLILLNSGNVTLAAANPSPPFTPPTSAVRQNCVFLASLCLSLFAASGAVQAKQWLQKYQYTGQKGSAEKQGMRRTKKFYGAKWWRLDVVVEALPNLLLISVALFFVALVDLLWTINSTVALTVLMFTAVGAGFWALGLAAAVLSKDCPFQTAFAAGTRTMLAEASRMFPLTGDADIRRYRKTSIIWHDIRSSRGLRRLSSIVSRSIPEALRHRVTHSMNFVVQSLHLARSINIYHDLFRRLQRAYETLGDGFVKPDDEEVHARAALWIVETTPENENLDTVAGFIPTLSSLEAVQLINHSRAFLSLISHLHVALRALHLRHTPESLESALVAAKAVVHALLSDPLYWDTEVRKILLDGRDLDWKTSPSWLRSPDLMILCVCIIRLSCRKVGIGSDLALANFPFEALVISGFAARNVLSPFTVITFIRHCIVCRRIAVVHEQGSLYFQLAIKSMEAVDVDVVQRMDELLSSESLEPSDGLLSLVSQALLPEIYRLAGGGTGRPSPSSVAPAARSREQRIEVCLILKGAWLGSVSYNESLFKNVWRTLKAYETYLIVLTRNPDRPPSLTLLRCHNLLLQRMLRRYPCWKRYTQHFSSSATSVLEESYNLVEGLLSIDPSPARLEAGWDDLRNELTKCKAVLSGALDALRKGDLQDNPYAPYGQAEERAARARLETLVP